MNTNLSIPEQFLIIAHRPARAGFSGSALSADYIKYGVVGAILLDLSIHDALRIENNIVATTGKNPELYPMADKILQKIRSSRKQKKIKHWVKKLGSKGSAFKKEGIRQLENKGMIRTEKKKFLGLIPYYKTYLPEQKYRSKLRERLRSILLASHKAQPDEAILLGLIEACKIHRVLISQKQERRKIKKALKQFNRENVITRAVGDSLKEIQAAIMASISASAAASSAASGS